MIILVLGFLIIIGVCFLTSQKIILTPQMCFALCFLPGIIYENIKVLSIATRPDCLNEEIFDVGFRDHL